MPETPTHMPSHAHGMAAGGTGMQMSRQPLDQLAAAAPSVASLSRGVSKDGRSPSDALAHQSSFAARSKLASKAHHR